MSGQFDAALNALLTNEFRACLEHLESMPTVQQQQPHVLAVRALAHAQLGQHLEAVAIFRRLRRLEPRDVAHVHNLTTSLRALGDHQGALEQTAVGLEMAPDYLPLRIVAAQTQIDRGDYRAAHEHLRRVAPDQHTPESLTALGYVLIQLDREVDAREALDRALRLGLRSPDDLISAGVLANLLQQYDLSETLFRQALQHARVRALAAENLACQYERQNRLDEAKSLLAACADIDNDDLALARARVLSRSGGVDEAISIYQALIASDRLATASRHSIYFDLGKLLDRCGRYDEAFTAFDAGHRIAVDLLHTNHPELLSAQPPEDWENATGAAQPPRWTPTPGERRCELPSPVFVVGFPRSGTTLIEQVLGSHPNLSTLDEVVAIDRAVHELNVLGHPYPECLADLDASLLDRAEAAYWHEVRKHFHGDPSRRIVDKYPFNLVRLPMILRLFPDARIVMMLRHPLDCVLSCYMQKFRLNKGTPMWATLESTATLYHRAMSAYVRDRDMLQAPILELKYENLVRNFEPNVRALVDYIGEPWDDRVFDYSLTATARGRISTPSYAQVTRPIYTDSLARWKRYRRYLQTAAALVAPYIEMFDYEQ